MKSVLLLAVTALISWWTASGPKDVTNPQTIIQDHAVLYRSQLQVSNITDIELDSVELFRKYICLSSDDLEELRRGLRTQLMDVPARVADKMVALALAGNFSMETSGREGGSNPDKEGRAYFTVYKIATEFKHGTVKTCVLVSGVEMAIADAIIGEKNTTYTDVIGYQPCHCGRMWCESCPIVVTRTVSEPQFKRYVMTLAKHNEMFHYISAAALELVPVDGTGSIESTPETQRLAERWSGSSVPHFHGSRGN